jgi:Mg/Co/Ni transporter MgtE
MKIENQSALNWYTDDVRNAVECLSQAKQNKFYQIVGESDRDLRTYFECLLEDRQETIIQFINEQIADAVYQTLQDNEVSSI